MDEMINCRICGEAVHAIRKHLPNNHPDYDEERYKREFPDAPLLSPAALRKLEERLAAKAKEEKLAMAGTAGAKVIPIHRSEKQPLHEVFGLGKVKGAMTTKGGPIPVTVIDPGEFEDMVPAVDPDYVFDLEVLKMMLMGVELNMPVLAWGFHGTGKTTLLEQICARTRRPMIRVQHTVNMEESHVLGSKEARGGETVFEYGPLAMAMLYGWFYLADEYDFGQPAVVSVYQPVLEGRPLFIKEAEPHRRLVKPHPNFRFGATGNTNGSGDESGLYQGTFIQNAANYDRFGVTVQVPYMPAKLEEQILVQKAGVHADDATRLVDLANRVREEYKAKKISNTLSPRTLIRAGLLGMLRSNFESGIQLAFSNKLSAVDKEVVDGLAMRIFRAS